MFSSLIFCRYKRLLCSVDLSKDFFFSYSYNIMRSLQKNITEKNTGHSSKCWALDRGQWRSGRSSIRLSATRTKPPWMPVQKHHLATTGQAVAQTAKNASILLEANPVTGTNDRRQQRGELYQFNLLIFAHWLLCAWLKTTGKYYGSEIAQTQRLAK
ncbi:hypothetical protein SETIT_3G387600v2 [Setaria italica]|uniref:Uncharacterized protein n=1 Tax=Setaria italica TaxID=4555 RepID=K3ZCF3_SETIT|nr:hypothetical protein SETIT_3G387600v2 [Setaria italica]